MKRVFTTPTGRGVLFLAGTLLCTLAFWTVLITGSQWDNLWTAQSYPESYNASRVVRLYEYYAQEVEELLQTQALQGRLDYTDQQRLSNLQKFLSPENTNYRVAIHGQDGTLHYTNLPAGESLEDCQALTLGEQVLTWGDDLVEYDYFYYDELTDKTWLVVYREDGTYLRCDPAADPGGYNAYGYRASSDGTTWSSSYWPGEDSRIHSLTYTIQSGMRWPLAVQDYFSTDYDDYQVFQTFLPAISITAILSSLAFLWCLWALCSCAGRRRGREGLVLSPLDRVPLDLLAVLAFFAFLFLFSAGDSAAYASNQTAPRMTVFVGLACFTLAGSALFLLLVSTLAVRWKAGHMLRNTLTARLFSWLRRLAAEAAANWSMARRPVKTFLLYLLGTVLTGITVILIPFYQGFVLWRLCLWFRQWRAIREGTRRIVGGDPDYKIDTSLLYRDLREHAQQLNDLGSAVSTAVEERLKSERFKAELITNVSHDLKTPLTSIINYVDLLKKEDIQDPKALEYLEVLDRKSQRLKKLTEDLVEASKASTGALTVVRERLGFTQLLDQALGEYEEKFRQSGLTPVLTAPDHELYVEADGRHLWRVIDNLLGNCVKYALAGTRVYLDVKSWDGNVTLSIKNVSRDPLNLPAEQLMERFVRGDDSRTTEGSGLGLSIARSLTELQGGTFRLDIDGDLFKAVVVFPEYRDPLPLTGGPQGASG